MIDKKLEVVVTTKEEAIIAQAAGADRLEISINPSRRGTTPDINEISGIIPVVDIPLYILIRPNQFTYECTDKEFILVTHMIEICKLTKAKGITIGFIKDGKVDKEKLQQVLNISGDLEVNFSRAVDSTINYEEEINYLFNLKQITKIYTSGSAETVIDGAAMLKKVSKFSNKLIFSGALNIDGIEKLIDKGIEAKVYQVNSGVRDEYKYENLISYEKCKKIKELMSDGKA